MDDILNQQAAAYSRRRKIAFAETLGAGVHGVVKVVEDNVNFRRFAVKFHRYRGAYLREREAYRHLAEQKLVTILGFNVPQLLGWSEEDLAIEMTVVDRPFVLDFGDARLDDDEPEFSDEVWSDWDRKIDDVFEDRAEEVRRVLAVLRSHGVIMLDVHPGNIRFGE